MKELSTNATGIENLLILMGGDFILHCLYAFNSISVEMAILRLNLSVFPMGNTVQHTFTDGNEISGNFSYQRRFFWSISPVCRGSQRTCDTGVCFKKTKKIGGEGWQSF